MMIKKAIPMIALSLACLAFGPSPASAQATRTWVSGVGNDANPCSRTAPCKTFAGAISKTATGGEINALDPGGFGAVTITKSITIDGGGGQVASVLAAGTNGIIINAGTGVVTLRNIRVNGVAGSPTPGLNGIQILAASAVHIEHSSIFGFSQNGINVNLNTAAATRVFVTDTTVTNSAVGINVHNTANGNVLVAMQRTTTNQNSTAGVRFDGAGGTGFLLGTLADSMVAGNGTGVAAIGGASSGVGLHVTRSSVVNNVTIGAQATSANAQILFSNTIISGNGTALSSVSGGSLVSYKSNSTEANFNLGGFTSTVNPE